MRSLAAVLLAVAAIPAAAHHSFAIYDMQQNVEFHGVIDTVKFRNPHMAMTLTVTSESGEKRTINFVEGAPANMLARLGLKPALIEPGKEITAIGAPTSVDCAAMSIECATTPADRQRSPCYTRPPLPAGLSPP